MYVRVYRKYAMISKTTEINISPDRFSGRASPSTNVTIIIET